MIALTPVTEMASVDTQRGVVLISVIVALTVVGGLLLAASYQSSAQIQSEAGVFERAQLGYLAETALQKALWQLNDNQTCASYSDLAAQAFGAGTIEADIDPNSGSPVSVTAVATLANGLSMSRSAVGEVAYASTASFTLAISSNGKDTFIEGQSSHNDHNKDTDWELKVRGTSGLEYRSLLKFDLTVLPPEARIESAELQLIAATGTSNADQFVAYPLTQSWTSSETTWLEAANGVSWLTPGGVYDSTSGVHARTSGGSTYSIDLTSLLGAWLDGSAENLGLIVMAATPGSATDAKFYSAEDDAATVPKLIIQYRCPCGTICEVSASASDLLSHWPFDEISGTRAEDVVGSNDGELENGPSWGKSGVLNSSLGFDGNNDQVMVKDNNSLDLVDALTITAWIYGEDPGLSSGYRIVSKETNGRNDNYWLAVFSGEVAAGIDTDIFTTSNLNLQAGRWYHLAFSFDDKENRARIYLDGVLREEYSTTKKPKANKDALYIANNHEGKAWEGLLDDVRLYGAEIPGADILALASVALPPVDDCSDYADSLETVSWSGSDGTLDWSKQPWEEVGESDGVSSGDIRIMNDLGELALRLRDNDNGGEGVERSVDLSGMTSARFSFYYSRVDLDSSSDYVSVQISLAGTGGPYKELVRYQGPGTDDTYYYDEFDISDYVSATTRFRFITSPSMGNTDTVFFDDFRIECIL